MQMAISAQFTVNLYHFFSSYQLSPLQLLFYGLESPSFRLSKTALLASFGSDGGHWRFFKENEWNQPAGARFVSSIFSWFSFFFVMSPPAISWLPEIGAWYGLCGLRTTGGGSIRPNGRSWGAEQWRYRQIPTGPVSLTRGASTTGWF